LTDSAPPSRRRHARAGVVSELLRTPSGQLAGLMATARRLEAVERALDGILDPGVRDHVHAARLERGILTLLADSPAWATRLRYLAPVLREQLDGPLRETLTEVRIHARPIDRPIDRSDSARAHAQHPGAPPRQAQLSADAAAVLESVAAATADPALRASLRRIARHGR
jgi:hypothetical protein